MTWRMMKKMNGINRDFKSSFESQVHFQEVITGVKCPSDNLRQFSYHIQAMVEELGEVMKADKRWKTHRNHRYEPDEKLDEIADVFITAMNIAIHSGFSADDIEKAISSKINENFERLLDERRGEHLDSCY